MHQVSLSAAYPVSNVHRSGSTPCMKQYASRNVVVNVYSMQRGGMTCGLGRQERRGISKRLSVTVASLGGGGKKKGLSREEEPDEYWTSVGEREGKSPFKDPLAIIGIVAIFLPFVILGLGIGLGWIDTAGGR